MAWDGMRCDGIQEVGIVLLQREGAWIEWGVIDGIVGGRQVRIQ